MKSLLSIIFCISYTFILTAQNVSCAQIFQNAILPETKVIPREQKVIIPVVFHNVFYNENQIISSETINAHIAALNDNFNLNNQDRFNISDESLGNLGISGIEFKLAEVDENDNIINGIIYTETDVEKIGNEIDEKGHSWIKQTEYGGSDPWNPNKYVNIWIGERTISLGYTIAKNSESKDILGIVLDYQTLKEEDKTLTHEMGHFLGLLHPWGNFTGCDGEDDLIDDTPFQAFPDFSCSPMQDCGSISKIGNYMDYSNDDCLLYFTKGQVLHMQQFLIQLMPELLNSQDCFAENFPINNIEYFYNPTYSGVEIYLPTEQKELEILIFSIDGKLIKYRAVKGENYLNIPTHGISAGIYVLQFKEADQLTAHKIFIQ